MTHDQEAQFSRSLIALMPAVRGYARVFLSPNDQYYSLYDDFAQQAFLKAWANRSRFAPGTNLKAWLFTILRNTIVSHYRHCWREVIAENVLDESTPDRTEDPEKSVCARQALDCIKLLNEHQRQVLIDIGWHELSYDEMAKAYRIPTGTVKSRVSRARHLLAELTETKELHYGRRTSRPAMAN